MSETTIVFFRNAAVPHELHTDRSSWRMAWIKPLGTRAHSSRPQSFPVRIHQENRGNSIWSLRIGWCGTVVEDFSEARTAGDHLQRSLLRHEKRFLLCRSWPHPNRTRQRGAPARLVVRRARRLPGMGELF